MTNKKTITVIAVLFVALLGWGAYAIWGNRSENGIEGAATSTDASFDLPGIDYAYVGKSSSTPVITTTKLPKAPSLDRSFTPPSYFLPDIAASSTEQITRLIKAIKAEPGNAGLWAELAFYRKGIEDYQGAKEALEYSLALNSKNAVVTENLGVIYGDYLHDAKNAEKYYLAAIKLEPEVSYRYLRLFELYTNTKQDAKAKAIIEQGLKVNPQDPSLRALLESLK